MKSESPHVTEIAEVHTLLQTEAGDVLRLGYARLRRLGGWSAAALPITRSLAVAGSVGPYRDRTFWCSSRRCAQRATTRTSCLYLVNAPKIRVMPSTFAFEAQVLRWVGKPVVALLNQAGPPGPAVEEQAEVQRWAAHLESLGVASEVLTSTLLRVAGCGAGDAGCRRRRLPETTPSARALVPPGLRAT